MSEEVKEDKQIEEKAQQLVDEIFEEGEIKEAKEILDIMQSTLYKTLFQVLKRVILKIEIVNIENISASPVSAVSTEKKVTGDKKDDKPKTEFIEVKTAEELENSWKVTNENNQVAFIGKSLIDSVRIESNKAYLNISDYKNAKNWFNESKIQWNDS